MKDYAAADESRDKLTGRRERCIGGLRPTCAVYAVSIVEVMAAKCLVERAGTLVYGHQLMTENGREEFE